MKNIVLLITLIALAIGFSKAVAQEASWLLRARVVNISPAKQSEIFGSVPANALNVSDKAFQEIDVSYYLSADGTAELILNIPQEHDVKLHGAKIGSLKHLRIKEVGKEDAAVRLSVAIEHIDDFLADLDRTLKAA